MSFKILTSEEEIRSAWQSFNGFGFAFQTPDWFFEWSKLSGEPVVTLFLPNQIFLPCIISKAPAGMEVLRLAGGPAADYEAPFVTRSVVKIGDLLDEAINKLGVDGFYAGRSPVTIDSAPNPLLDLSHFEHFEKSYEVKIESLNADGVPDFLPKKLFADSHRQKRRLEELGRLEFRTPLDKSEASAWFNQLVTQKKDLFAARNQKIIFNNPMALRFYQNLTASEPTGFKVHLSALLLNGNPIALHWGLQRKDRYIYLLPSYDQGEFRKFSPGRLHLLELLKHCQGEQIQTFDFSLGDEAYKKDFCQDQITLAHCFRGRTLKFHLYTLALRAKNEVKRRRGTN